MGVYIKNIEMPRTCYDCIFRKRDHLDLVCPILGKSFKIADTQVLFSREKDCPLIPIPEHGRLIDADVLIDSFDPSDFWNSDAEDNCFAAIHVVNCAPTIIPAEEKI